MFYNLRFSKVVQMEEVLSFVKKLYFSYYTLRTDFKDYLNNYTICLLVKHNDQTLFTLQLHLRGPLKDRT